MNKNILNITIFCKGLLGGWWWANCSIHICKDLTFTILQQRRPNCGAKAQGAGEQGHGGAPTVGGNPLGAAVDGIATWECGALNPPGLVGWRDGF